jgi:hypothetical protein
VARRGDATAPGPQAALVLPSWLRACAVAGASLPASGRARRLAIGPIANVLWDPGNILRIKSSGGRIVSPWGPGWKLCVDRGRRHALPLLAGLHISVTGMSAAERQAVEGLCGKHGAGYHEGLVRRSAWGTPSARAAPRAIANCLSLGCSHGYHRVTGAC